MSLTPRFSRVAIVNRGEPAVRFIRALRDYNAERGTAVKSVAMVTDTDVTAPFARMADDVVHLGPAMQSDPSGGLVSAYLRHDVVIETLLAAGCDAVWPGWGFVAEDASFVAALEARNITFLGPSSAAMRRLGDKIQSKRLAQKHGVPIANWIEITPAMNGPAVLQEARKVGFPLMVKASAGGGGRGIRRVDHEDDVVAAIAAARHEVERIFGSGGLFLERCVQGARHVEVQFVSDAAHNTIALGVRDCSIQRRNQKLIEETPSPVLPDDIANNLCEATKRLASAAGYCSAGTAEFLYDPKTEQAYFLEVNSRLQVEHTVTECVTGADLVHAQIDVAMGLPLVHSGVDRGDGRPPQQRGWAIQARLCAEDATRDFAPSPGCLRVFKLPSGPGVRVDSGVEQGTEIAPEFDSMIAKVIASGRTRLQAIARLRRALQELQVVVEDGATNKALLLGLLQRPEVVDGTADTGWLDRQPALDGVSRRRRAFEAIALAAIVEYRRRRLADIHRLFAAAQDGIPQNPPTPTPIPVDLVSVGRKVTVAVADLGAGRYLVGPDGKLHIVTATFDGAHEATLVIGDERHDAHFAYGRKGIAIEVDGEQHTVEPASGGAVKAPAPAMVVQIGVAEGQRVAVGDRLVTLEAMKLEMPLYSDEAGIIKRVLCAPNQQVSAGQVLVTIEAEDAAVESQDNDGWPMPAPTALRRTFADGGLDFASLDGADELTAHTVMDDLVAAMQSVLLGYDVSAQLSQITDKLLGGNLAFSALQRPQRWLPVTRLLACFADLQALFDRSLPPSAGGAATSLHTQFYELCRSVTDDTQAWPSALVEPLTRALRWYGITSVDGGVRVREALWRMHVANHHRDRRHALCSLLLRTTISMHEAGVDLSVVAGLRQVLDRIARTAHLRHRYVADNARQAEYILFSQPRYVRRRQEVAGALAQTLAELETADADQRVAIVDELVSSPDSLVPLLLLRADPIGPAASAVLEAVMRRTYSESRCVADRPCVGAGGVLTVMTIGDAPASRRVAAVLAASPDPQSAVVAAADLITASDDPPEQLDVFVPGRHGVGAGQQLAEEIAENLANTGCSRVTVVWHNGNGLRLRTFVRTDDAWREDVLLRDIHPDYARRFELHRLTAFALTPIDTSAPVHAFAGRARHNPRDERIFVFTGVREIPDMDMISADPNALWELERAYFEGLGVLRAAQLGRTSRNRFHWNRLTIYVRQPVRLSAEAITAISERLEAPTRGLGLQKVVVRCRLLPPSGDGPPVQRAIVIAKPGKHRLQVQIHEPTNRPVRAMSDYALKLVRARRIGTVYPYELIALLTGFGGGQAPHPDLRKGRFIEHELAQTADGGRALSHADDGCRLVPVERPYGRNEAAVVVGVLENRTAKHPEGLKRVLIVADPTKAMCALAEPESRRIIGALDLASRLSVPVEWVSISAGARIAMDSGTENLDWTARVLKALVAFTQAGGTVHVIVHGVNVGAQSYWNAEATMLMHCRGLLIMTDGGSMVLTGKKALEYSGSVAAEDERGIGGFERVMGPNGQAQLFARDLGEAYGQLMDHYRHAYCAPGEALPRRFASADPSDRSILSFPYSGEGDDGFETVGQIFDDAVNPGRKRPFDVRAVMRATIDTDSAPLERFGGMTEGETAVVWDAHLGGYPVCMIGFQSRPLPRRGRIPTDGPDTWTGGTLFPQSSKKVARAINAASGNRPVVVLANLSGFDGSPESLRALQLEYGAEIGRAVVNFDGPILFTVIGRYHGGAYVVFSKALNSGLVALALTGTYASVIGGAPAAAVVFPREVARRTEADPRVQAARAALQAAQAIDKPQLRELLQRLLADVTLSRQGEVAAEFDAIHTVERAVEVGSLDAVISPQTLRPALVERLANWWQTRARRPESRNASALA